MSGSGVERNLERVRERLERDRETETETDRDRDRDRQTDRYREITYYNAAKTYKTNYVAYLLQCCSRYKIKSLNHYITTQCTKLYRLFATALSRVKVFKRERQTKTETHRETSLS